MNLLDSDEILQHNNKLTSFVLISPDRVDHEDVDIFVVKAPPVPRLDNINSINSLTRLCDACQKGLNYFGYYFDVLRSKGKEAAEDLPAACLLHTGAKTLQVGEYESCHLCVLLMANLRVKSLDMESVDQSNIEMCWQSDKPTPTRLHFALTHRGHPRSAKNYWNFFKLQIWPASEFDKALFSMSDNSEGMERHPSTASVSTRDNAMQWLKRCQANQDGIHNQCNPISTDWLPTRLLDVASAIHGSTLKLVMPSDSAEAFTSDRRYITLSHCWGKWGASQLPVLTLENMPERLQDGIHMSLLPKTFADAVQIAHWFNVRWLWIDSLCILQNSQDDWRQESVMMYDVYKNALLNISADDSPDAQWGCFRDRDPLSVRPMSIRFSADQKDLRYWLTPDTNAVFESITKSSLAKRGWVFQERQLSRRVLHFTSHELVWECCAKSPYFASETFPGGPPFKSAFNGKPKFQTKTDFDALENGSPEWYTAWAAICKEYSGKIFSHVHDKAVALSGLAQEFEVALPGDTYLAGIWRSTLPQSLLWQSSGSSGPVQKTEHYLAPSWSWLSIDGPISHFPPHHGSGTFSLVNIVDATTTPVLQSQPTASLNDASITMQCFMRSVEIRPDYEKKPWYMLAMGGGKAHKLVIKDEDGTECFCVDNFHSDAFEFSFDVEWDENSQSGPVSVAGEFVPLTMSTPTKDEALCLRGLLVESVHDKKGGDINREGSTYRRIGLLSIHGPHCQRFKYRMVRDMGNDQQGWDRLLKQLGPTHQSWEKLIRDKEEESGDDVTSDDPNENYGVQTDLGSVEEVERLYCLDSEVDRELGGAFERLTLNTITLV
ncbi:heterokaryon incompatibility protein-domain-containing protein [Triangularia verruculosa]|uniref:Heterokaryon incompatibility protein-domain-containing protein n=1 Tax=Triangularia verruculosa TaxID=2587418 RepID=A0AAN6XR73_9PEZI|nr:heterokaryon incompatibility protein-domain-containing protein [Triangularia verruculosa]